MTEAALKATIAKLEADAEKTRVESEKEIGTLKAQIQSGKPDKPDDPIVPMRVSLLQRITAVLQENPSPATPVGEIVQILALMQRAITEADGGFIAQQVAGDIRKPPTMDEVIERGRQQKEAADAIAARPEGAGPPS